MGFNKKQITEAGEGLGMTSNQAKHRHRELVKIPRVEKLGLTAAFFDLPEWSPEFADASAVDLAKAYAGARMIKECLRGLAKKQR